jgi:hypothetical protein
MNESFGFEVAIDHPSIAELPIVDVAMWTSIHARSIIDLFTARYLSPVVPRGQP